MGTLRIPQRERGLEEEGKPSSLAERPTIKEEKSLY